MKSWLVTVISFSITLESESFSAIPFVTLLAGSFVRSYSIVMR